MLELLPFERGGTLLLGQTLHLLRALVRGTLLDEAVNKVEELSNKKLTGDKAIHNPILWARKGPTVGSEPAINVWVFPCDQAIKFNLGRLEMESAAETMAGKS